VVRRTSTAVPWSRHHLCLSSVKHGRDTRARPDVGRGVSWRRYRRCRTTQTWGCPAVVCFGIGRVHGGVLGFGGGCYGASLCGCRRTPAVTRLWHRLTGTAGTRTRLSPPSSTTERLCGAGLLQASLERRLGSEVCLPCTLQLPGRDQDSVAWRSQGAPVPRGSADPAARQRARDRRAVQDRLLRSFFHQGHYFDGNRTFKDLGFRPGLRWKSMETSMEVT